jgi:hypothetical protein
MTTTTTNKRKFVADYERMVKYHAPDSYTVFNTHTETVSMKIPMTCKGCGWRNIRASQSRTWCGPGDLCLNCIHKEFYASLTYKVFMYSNFARRLPEEIRRMIFKHVIYQGDGHMVLKHWCATCRDVRDHKPLHPASGIQWRGGEFSKKVLDTLVGQTHRWGQRVHDDRALLEERGEEDKIVDE